MSAADARTPNSAVPSNNDTGDFKTPPNETRKVPVWERLYGAETESTARLKAHAQSDEKKVVICGFSGSGGKKSMDSPSFRMHAPRTPSSSTPKGGSKAPREKRLSSSNQRGLPSPGEKSGFKTPPSRTKKGTPPVWERLYGSETASTARLKAHAQSDEKKVKVCTFSGSGKKKAQ